MLDLILAGGFQHPDVNRPLTIDGRRVIPDFRWPTQRLVIEADGAEWHDNPIAREDDAERQAILEATASASSASRGSRRSPAAPRRSSASAPPERPPEWGPDLAVRLVEQPRGAR